MRCQCGATISDNVEYCPYCGRRHYIRTRPAQLTNQPVEPFQGYYVDGGGKTGCVGWFVSLTLSAIFLGVLIWLLWQDGSIDYLLRWLKSLTAVVHSPIFGVYTFPIPGILTL